MTTTFFNQELMLSENIGYVHIRPRKATKEYLKSKEEENL
jgi:hypothetical protein